MTDKREDIDILHPKDKGGDRDSLIFPFWIYGWTLGGRCNEPRSDVLLEYQFRSPLITSPVNQISGWFFAQSFHQTSPSSVMATLVNKVLAFIESTAFGLVCHEVRTSKNPTSGLIAQFTILIGFSQAYHLHSWKLSSFRNRRNQHRHIGLSTGTGVQRRYVLHLLDFPRQVSMCSAIHSLSRAIHEAMRRARHFLPKRAPPYPLPYETIVLCSGK